MSTKSRMMTGLLSIGLLAGGFLAPMVHADDNAGPPASGQQNGPQGGTQQHGGRPQAGFHLIPRYAEQKMELTDDQKQQVADLEKETKAKLEKILTPDQMKILTTARPPRPGQGGGPGGGGQADQGGNQGGGQGGPPPGN